MTATLEITPQLAEKLLRVAGERGLTLEEHLSEDLESRYLLPGNLVFSSLGISESNLTGEDSEPWLGKRWSTSL